MPPELGGLVFPRISRLSPRSSPAMIRPLPLKRLPCPPSFRGKTAWWNSALPDPGGHVLRCFWRPGLIWRSGQGPSGYFNLAFNWLAFLHSLLAWIALRTATPLTTADLALHRRADDWFRRHDQQPRADCAMTNHPVAWHVLAQIAIPFGFLEMDWGWPRFFGLFLSLFEAGLWCLGAQHDSLSSPMWCWNFSPSAPI